VSNVFGPPARPRPFIGLHQAFEATVGTAPGSVAALDERQTVTYRELDQRADALAAHLRSLGVGAGEPVGIHLAQSVEFAVGLLGVLKAGAACLPLDPGYPHERLAWMIRDARATVVLTTTSTGAPEPTVRVVELDRPGQPDLPGARLPFDAGPESPAYIIYTSGSTGRPKGVLLSHRGLVNHQLASVRLYGLGPEDAVLHLGSIGFDISIEAIFPTWAAGGRVVFRPEDAPLSGSAFLTDLERLGITVLDLPTAFWHQWVRDLSSVHATLPSSLRTVIVGGERAVVSAFARWREIGARARWFNTYGPTEASVIATAWEAAPSLAEVPDDLPIGRPIDGVRLVVLGPDGAVVGPGQAGELYIAGAGVALGYLNRPELTAERFVPDPAVPGALMYRTGDMVQWEGDNLHFRGRVDDQVKIRGFRVEPGEVEAALLAWPGVDQAVVVARPGPGGEQRLLGYVVARAGAVIDGAEILRMLPERLPLHLVPAAVTVLEALPLTPNGKVDKQSLPDVTRAERRLVGPVEPPRDGIDRALVDIWEEVLAVAPVGIDDDFFMAGGHSLAAVRMLGMVEWLVSIEVPMRALLEEPTIRHVADAIRSGSLLKEFGLLQTVAAGAGLPPLVYICTVETGVVALRHVLPFLDPGQPVYAYVLRKTANLPDVGSIEALAAVGLAELRERFPSDAYRIMGYSLGGLVAYEMAQQLAASGCRVDLLVLLDTWAPGASEGPPELQGATSLRGALRLARRGASVLVRDPARLARHLRGPGPAVPAVAVPSGPDGAALLLDDGSLSAIYDGYGPAPYTGRVLLLSTQTSVRRFGSPLLGWRPEDASAWRCAPVPGEHGSLMFRDNAPVVGREIAAALAGRTAPPAQYDKSSAQYDNVGERASNGR